MHNAQMHIVQESEGAILRLVYAADRYIDFVLAGSERVVVVDAGAGCQLGQAGVVAPTPKYTRGVLAKYAKLVGSARYGAVLD